MTHPQCPDTIRPECEAKLDAIHADVKLLRKAVLGNGDSDRGLIARVAAHGLALKIIGTAVGILAAAALTAALSGCATPASGNQSTPVATAAPEITARDVQEIKSEIKQVQTTVQTVDHALDDNRAEVQKLVVRKSERERLTERGIGLGLILLFIVAPSPIPKKYHAIGYLIGLGIIGTCVGLPLIWPF